MMGWLHACYVWFYPMLQAYSGVIRKASEEKFSYVVIQKLPKQASTEEANLSASDRAAASLASAGTWLQPSPSRASNMPAAATMGTASGSVPAGGDRGQDVGEGRDPTPLDVLERFMTTSRQQLPRLLDDLIDEVSRPSDHPTNRTSDHRRARSH